MAKSIKEFYNILLEKFPFQPTNSQNALMWELAEFLLETKSNALFLIKGYAGTGKTTTISTVVNSLWKIHKSSFARSYGKSGKGNFGIFK